MKTVIFGGAGFIGCSTASGLLDAGHQVRVCDSFDPQIHGSDYRKTAAFRLLSEHCEISVADVRDPESVDRALRDVDAVYFFAAGTGTGQSMYQVHRYCDVNILGAAVLAEALPRYRDRICKVVVSSSRAVFGEGAGYCPNHERVFPGARNALQMQRGAWEAQCPKCGEPVEPLASEESDAWHPVSIYGTTKLAQEQVVVQTCKNLGIPTVAFRYQNVYGPGQALRNPYTGILSIFSQQIANGRPVRIFEDGQPTRDFVHVKDVVHYNIRAIEVHSAGCITLNVGSGCRTKLVELPHMIGTALGKEPQCVVSGEFRAGDIRHACADLKMLTGQLGPREFIEISDGVRELVEWISSQDIGVLASTAYESSLDEMRRVGLMSRVT